MSGDVQPRKRKDKKRKRDSLDRRSEADIVITRKASLTTEDEEVIHHGVHATKMGTDDVHLHVQADHDTGGNWCAKIFFFSLLAILVGLIGLIILENRGLSDLDTPLSESKYKDYFEGWVDEHREHHDDHHDVVAHEIEEHDEHDEPFEEEEDHQDEDEDEDEHDSHDEDDDDNDDETAEDNETAEEDSENNTAERDSENNTAEDDKDNDDDNEDEDDNDDNKTEEDDNEEESIQKSSSKKYESVKHKRSAENKDEDDDDDDDSDANANDDDDDDDEDDDDEGNNNSNDEKDDDDDNDGVSEKDQANKKYQNNDDDDDDNDDDDDDDDNDEEVKTNSLNKNKKVVEDDDPFDEEEYDGTFESLEDKIVDNDAEEIRLLQEKAKLAKQNEKSTLEEEESASASILVKIGVGLVLAYVARLVIIKKGPEDDKRTTEPDSDILMQRRLTIAPDNIPFENNEDELIYDNEFDEDELVSSENGEIEDEEYIEEIEIEIEDDQDEESGNLASALKYSPETFEQLSSMFRKKNNESSPSLDDIKKNIIEPVLIRTGIPSVQSKMTTNIPMTSYNASDREKSPILKKIEKPISEQTKPTDIIDYENEELEEEMEDEMIDEEEDEEDVSDIDDSDLMKRLDEKYGKIPDREYESEDMDEDEEEIDDDNSWTKIKRSSGAQNYEEDDIDNQLNRANDEMLRNNFKAALQIYEDASIKNPNNPKVFYGKAKALKKLSEIYKNDKFVKESIDAYKKVLAFHDRIDDEMFKAAANNCIANMRILGLDNQAFPIHKMLIARFNNDPEIQNELAITYLITNNLVQAKLILEKTITKWPNNGKTQVHFGYVLANLGKNLSESVKYLKNGIDSNAEGTQHGRFYHALGKALERLGRISESRDIYRKGALNKIFLSEYQRSIHNVENLKSKPFWSKKDTTYESFLNMLEENWQKIREEGINALSEQGYFVDEAENLTDFGSWKEYKLFAGGVRLSKNCLKTPNTCNLVEAFPAAISCKWGSIKFSVLHPNTHGWPHCSASNTRLRSHLGLIVPSDTWIRVANETIRSWEEGKFLIFDDSFEHEVWNNSTTLRLVLIVDFWHPNLSESQRHQSINQFNSYFN